jgi:uncharacterized OB-fold protein
MPFWNGLEEGVILYQRCRACGSVVWHPRFLCPACLSRELAWEQGSGRGALYSHSVVRHAPYAYWTDKVPYALGVVQMDEGYFLFGRLLGTDPATREIFAQGNPLRIGARLRATVEKTDGETRLVFVPDSGSDGGTRELR